jgi:transcriptional regulator with XRE-family HTH domain
MGAVTRRASESDEFAARLCSALDEAGMTRRALAEAVGVTANTVSNWTTGTTRPRLDLAERVASELGVSLALSTGKESGTAAPVPPLGKGDEAEGIVHRLAGTDVETALQVLVTHAPDLMQILADAKRHAQRGPVSRPHRGPLEGA